MTIVKDMGDTGDTNDLARRLVEDLTPVVPQRLAPKMALWLATFVIFEVLALAIVGLRPDVTMRLLEPAYAGSLAALVLGFAVVSWFAWLAAIPGRMTRRPTLLGFALLGWAFVALAAYSAPVGSHVETDLLDHLFCCLRMVGGAMIPTIVLLAMTSRLAPMNVEVSVGYAMIAATFTVMIAAQLNCPYESLDHVLLGHGLMVLAVNGLTFFLHRAIFRRLAAANLRRRTDLVVAGPKANH